MVHMQLKEVEDTCNAEKEKLKALQAEGAKLSDAFSDACLELNGLQAKAAEALEASAAGEVSVMD